MGTIASLIVRLSGDTAEFTRAMHGAANTAKRVAQTILGALGAAGIGSLISQTASYFDDLSDAASRTGMSVAGLAGLRHEAEKLNVGAQDVDTAITKMLVSIGDAAQGLGHGGGKHNIFEQLGLDPKQLAGMDTQKALETVSEAISKLPTLAERSSVAVAVFSKKTRAELFPLLTGGAEGIRNLMEEQERLAGGWTRLGTLVAGRLDDQLKDLHTTLANIGRAIGAWLVPAVSTLVSWIQTAVSWITGMTTRSRSAWGELASFALKTLAVASAMGIVIPAVISLVSWFRKLQVTTIVLQALSGPKGWITLAAGLAIAAGAVMALDAAQDAAFADMEQKTSGVDSSVGALAQHIHDVEGATDAVAKSAERAEESFRSWIEDLRIESVFGEMSSDARRLYDLTQLSGSALREMYTESQRGNDVAASAARERWDELAALKLQADEYIRINEARREAQQWQEKSTELLKSLATPMDDYLAREQEILKLRKRGLITREQQDALSRQAWAETAGRPEMETRERLAKLVDDSRTEGEHLNAEIAALRKDREKILSGETLLDPNTARNTVAAIDRQIAVLKGKFPEVEFARSVLEDMKTPAEKTADYITELGKSLDAGADAGGLTWDQYAKAVRKAKRDLHGGRIAENQAMLAGTSEGYGVAVSFLVPKLQEASDAELREAKRTNDLLKSIDSKTGTTAMAEV